MSVSAEPISEYLNSDLNSLMEIYLQARYAEKCFPKDELTRKKFSSLVQGELIFTYLENDVVVGFVSIWPPERFVHHLYVLPEFQNKGVGTKLLDHCVKLFGLPISLKSLAANKRACLYYETHNWTNEKTGRGSDGLYHHYWLR